MLRLIFFLVLAAVLSALGIWLADQSGTVVISWPDVIGPDRPLPVGIVVVMIALVALAVVIVFELLRVIVTAPKKMASARGQNKELQGYQEVASGLMAVAAGDLAAARQHDRHAEKLLNRNAASLLLSAQTAQLEGKEDVAQIKFKQMRESDAGELLGLRGLLAQAIKSGDDEDALSLAREAYRKSPTTPWVLTTYFDLLTRTGAWKQAFNVVIEMGRQGLLDNVTSRRYRAILHHQLAVELDNHGDPASALEAANKAVHLEPGFVPAAVQRSRIATGLGQARVARSSLINAWRVQAHPELADAFAKLEPDETSTARLKRFRKLYEQRPNDVVSKVVMARVAMAARDWAAARTFLERAIELGPTASVYRLLAELEKATGGSAEKIEAWNAKLATSKPDRVWVCEDTGEILQTWQAFGRSGRFGAIHWVEPPAVTTMLPQDRPTFALANETADVSPVPAQRVSHEQAAAANRRPPIATAETVGPEPIEARPAPPGTRNIATPTSAAS